MRVFITVLVLIFSLQSLTKADDIRDFEIEGMSIGDSALDYFSKSEIKKNKRNWYRGKKYSTSEIGDFQISYKTKDYKYILVSIDKMKTMDIAQCLKEIPLVVDEIAAVFSDKVKLKGPERIKHWADKSKKSWYDQYEFKFPNKDSIVVECYNWSTNVTWLDHLRVRIVSKEFFKFLNDE